MTKMYLTVHASSGSSIVLGDNMASHHVSEQKVWDFFVALFDGNEYAAAGACGNMQVESGLCSDNAENLWNQRTGHSDEWLTSNINDGTIDLTTFLQRSWWVNAYGFGYGLSQWTTSARRTMLWDRTITLGLDIDDEDAQLGYIQWEFTDGPYSSVRTAMIAATSIEEATRIYCDRYEVGTWTTARLTNATHFYDTYATGDTRKFITVRTSGNGTAVANPNRANAGETIELTCTPATGESLLDIIGTTVTGYSVALAVQLYQTFPMPSESMYIDVEFTGTPPTPPTPTGIKRKGMPIWMYPSLRC